MVFSSFSCELMKRNVYSDMDSKPATITAVTHNGSSITYTAANSFAVNDVVTVTGLDTEAYNVSNATVTSRNSTSFTVAKSGTTASVTEASSSLTAFTYYASNTFSAGDVVSISGFKTATITAATTAAGKITYTAAGHGFAVNDVINVTGISEDSYNKSNAVITNKTDNTFSISAVGTGTPTFVGAAASIVYNKTNVDIVSATDYYFTVADTSNPPTVVLTTSGTATLYSESTQFPVTGFEPTVGTSVKYTLLNNVATISFSDTSFSTYSWNIGDSITISGCSNSVFNGTYTVSAVPSASSVSFAKTNTDIALDSSATGSAVNNTWSSGMIKYTATNTFAKNDIISISGITPSEYNNSSARVAYATSSYFLVPGDISVKYRKSGSALSIFNLSNVVVSAVTKDTFTVPFTSAAGYPVTGLSAVTVNKHVNYTAYAKTVALPQEFWTVSLSLEEV